MSMNIITNSVLKPIANLKNNKGEFTEKNAFVVSLLKKCTELQIGNSFEVETYFKKTSSKISNGTTSYTVEFTKDFLKLDFIANLCNNLTVALIDRSIVPFYNKNNVLCIKVLAKKEFEPLFFITDKNSVINAFEKCYNPLTKEFIEVTVKGIKGKRTITDSDINEIKTNLKAMGISLKEVAILQKK